MSFQDINWLSVLISILFTLASGAIWFGPKTFYPKWMKAMNLDQVQHPEKSSMKGIFGGLFIAVILEVIFVTVIVTSLKNGSTNFGICQGALTGFFLGLAICSLPNLTHRLFAGHGYKVWLIENGNDVLNMTIIGAIAAGMS